jgi:predicted NAD/FAD-dependent oxidoreductase
MGVDLCDVIVLGAGVAGLSLARQLTAQGRKVRIIEKSRGVGGRCATRRVNGLPVDHGLPLLHGRSSIFAETLAAMTDAQLIADWPIHRRGPGTPCQPQGFDSQSYRLAIGEGVSAFAKFLARGLKIQLNTAIERIRWEEGCVRLFDQQQREYHAHGAVVLSCPVPQALELLQPLAALSKEMSDVLRVLSRVHMVPCLTLLAGYEARPPLPWQLYLPGPEHPLHSIIEDSSKRPREDDEPKVFVLQAKPRFSRKHLEEPPERWSALLLQDAAELLGPWIRQPLWHQCHVWRYARVQPCAELSRSILLTGQGGPLLGLCGDAFHPARGVEGAFLSGIELAQRLEQKMEAFAASPAEGEAPGPAASSFAK